MAAAVAATSSAVLSGATRPLHPAASTSRRSSVLILPPLPSMQRRLFPSIATSLLPEAQRFASLRVRASEDTSGSVQVDDLVADLKEKWDGLENKSTVLIYGGGALVAVWLSSIVVGAINSVPLLPKIMELVGLGYTGWFVYRYLLFKSGRKELATDIEDLKKKISGAE